MIMENKLLTSHYQAASTELHLRQRCEFLLGLSIWKVHPRHRRCPYESARNMRIGCHRQ